MVRKKNLKENVQYEKFRESSRKFFHFAQIRAICDENFFLCYYHNFKFAKIIFIAQSGSMVKSI